MSESESGERKFLRHTVATLAYRGGKALRGAPHEFAAFAAGPTSRAPGAILAHLCDLMDWAASIAEGEQRWFDSTPGAWETDVARFHAALAHFDEILVRQDLAPEIAERLFQGPIADALTHVGQLAMLRRLAGAPMKGENYFKAEIVAGRVGSDQAAPRREFD